MKNVGRGSGKDIFTLTDYVEKGELDQIREVFRVLFASIPYTTEQDPFEHDFQSVIYITLTLLGQYVKCEQHTMHYADPYAADQRVIYRIGVNFSSETRQLEDWKVAAL